MKKKIVTLMTSGCVVVAFAPAFAQAPRASQNPVAALRPDPSQSATAALADRYQIGLMEGILQRAAEHGAKVTRDRARTVVPGDMLLSDEVRVRGIRLPEYGVFFYIDMPDLEETLPWIFSTLDRNDLGRDSALRELRALVDASGNANDRQALERLEMQLLPSGAVSGAPGGSTLLTGQPFTGSAASTRVDKGGTVAVDPILSDPQGVYRAEVSEALIDAILDHSTGLRLDPKEWFTVAARGKEGAARLSPADAESPTIEISLRGEDLIAFLAHQITRDEARNRVAIKVF